jgi:acyl-[acyl-carrier-protein]-phospholipid O-acyltransferase/long-chain-fatty-acid--[acyl-carrier-protein] ligase
MAASDRAATESQFAPSAHRASGQPFEAPHLPSSLLDAVRRARRRSGGATIILEDADHSQLSYDQLLDAAYALGAQLRKITIPGDAVGVMLPTCIGALVCFLALHAAGCTPAMLNYTAGENSLRAACTLAGVRLILTSRRFLTEARLEPLAERVSPPCSMVFLEDMRQAISWREKAAAFLTTRAPIRLQPPARANDRAAILFTSGTTGAPKATVLSHANLIANVEQCRQHGAFEPDWVFFNTLPVFHAFGLTGGALLPLLIGLKTVLYPSPLHHEKIPKLVRDTRASVLVSTDTFALAYARSARAGELSGLKYAVLGGERVRAETRSAYAELGVTVLEGYGATECSPVAAFNQPRADRPGTVGTLLPGMEARLEPVPGVRDGGRLYLRGPNVMLGYLADDGSLSPPPEGWFDTGDLAKFSTDGFLTILGRLKRFARIGAEMVSLDAVEAHACELWPNARHAALVTRGARGGEEIVLVTDQPDATAAQFRQWLAAHGASLLEAPKRILVTVTVPTLAMGKIDYQAAQSIARAHGEDGNHSPQANGRSGA